jgi:hypothetical protein
MHCQRRHTVVNALAKDPKIAKFAGRTKKTFSSEKDFRNFIAFCTRTIASNTS